MTTIRKTRKQFILDQDKIRRVRKSLHAKTDTEAVDKALDMVLAETQIWTLMESFRGKVKIRDVYGRLSDS